jgi:hypothetical protein
MPDVITKAAELPPQTSVKTHRVPKVDDKVHLVTAPSARNPRTHLPATITKVNKNGTVDLVTDEERPHVNTGKPEPIHIITSSPFDAAGTLGDSWHFAD